VFHTAIYTLMVTAALLYLVHALFLWGY